MQADMITALVFGFSTAGMLVLRRLHHDRALKRREKLVVSGLQRASLHSPLKKRTLSERQLELEQLIRDLETTNAALVTALNAQAEFDAGELSAVADFGEETPSLSRTLEQWRKSNAAVESAQFAHCQATYSFREFVESLPPALRQSALERSAGAMAASHA